MGLQNIATLEMIQNVVDGVTPVAKATNATNAVNDGNGRNIANTYATKSEAKGEFVVHNITFMAYNLGDNQNASYYFTLQIFNNSPIMFTATSLIAWLKQNFFDQESQQYGDAYFSCVGFGAEQGAPTVFWGCKRGASSAGQDVFYAAGGNSQTGIFASVEILPDQIDNFYDRPMTTTLL